MICNNCKNEFTNIDGLKFCPYCGFEIEDAIVMEVEQVPDEINIGKNENISKEDTLTKIHEDTQPMPAITDKDIKKYNMNKFFSKFKKPDINKFFSRLKKPDMNLKVIIPMIALLIVIAGGVFAYTFFIVKPVDAAMVKEDLMGKVITLPKGTIIKISKDYMKSFSINSRNTDKKKDEIKVALTLNNGTIEAKTMMSIVYTSEGNNKWKLNEKIVLEGVTAIKPVVGIDETNFLAGLKKLNINISDQPVALGGQEVKNLVINLKTPDLENGKEEIQVKVSMDSGLLATNGNIKCKLVFQNENWMISTIEKNSNDDFILALSPTFSDEKVIEAIRKKGMEETVSYPSFFAGKGFTVKDSFTKNISISGKRFDVPKGVLYVNAKRENKAGEIKSVLSTGYTFSISFTQIALTDQTKTTVSSGTINNVASPLIISTIANVEIEGSNLFFWFSNNHKITTEEAKTFKTDKIVFSKNSENIKYVYGSVKYTNGKKNKSVSLSFVALYFLVYDETKGYNWKLDKIIGEDSPNYKAYSNEVKNQ